MYPMTFVKGRTSSRLQSATLGAPPPLILGFHPSKRHAALITSCDQGSVVLAFTLVLLVLKRFLWRVMLVILMSQHGFQQIYCAFVAYHLRISCSLYAFMLDLKLILVAEGQLRRVNTLLLFYSVDLICYGSFLFYKDQLNICQVRPYKRIGCSGDVIDALFQP